MTLQYFHSDVIIDSYIFLNTRRVRLRCKTVVLLLSILWNTMRLTLVGSRHSRNSARKIFNVTFCIPNAGDIKVHIFQLLHSLMANLTMRSVAQHNSLLCCPAGHFCATMSRKINQSWRTIWCLYMVRAMTSSLWCTHIERERLLAKRQLFVGILCDHFKSSKSLNPPNCTCCASLCP